MSRPVLTGIGIGLAACAAGIGVWALLPTRPIVEESDDSARSEREIQAVAGANFDRWASAPKLELGGMSDDELTGIFEIALSDTGPTPAPAEAIATLSARLAKEARIRSGTDPDAYLSWADSRRGERWITPQDSQEWSRESMVMQELFGETLTPATFRDFARRMIGQSRIEEEGAVFRGIGDPNRCTAGCFRARAFRVRSAEQFYLNASESFDTEQEADEWTMSPSTSISRLRVADRSIDEICRESGSALVIEVAALMELEGGRSGIWESAWYWDPKSATWQLETMSWRSGHIVGMWY